MRLWATIMAVCVATSASAQMAQPCPATLSPDAVVEPWEDTTATFANGDVRVAVVDRIEPAAAALYLMILHPPFDEFGARRCTLVGRAGGQGYAGLFFEELTADYDPALGLSFELPAIIYLPEENFQNSALLRATVNQATGEVTVAQKLGNE